MRNVSNNEKRADILTAACSRVLSIYGTPVLMSGLASLVLNPYEVNLIHQHHKNTLRCFQKLHDDTPHQLSTSWRVASQPQLSCTSDSCPCSACSPDYLVILSTSMLRIFWSLASRTTPLGWAEFVPCACSIVCPTPCPFWKHHQQSWDGRILSCPKLLISGKPSWEQKLHPSHLLPISTHPTCHWPDHIHCGGQLGPILTRFLRQ